MKEITTSWIKATYDPRILSLYIKAKVKTSHIRGEQLSRQSLLVSVFVLHNPNKVSSGWGKITQQAVSVVTMTEVTSLRQERSWFQPLPR